MYTRADAQVKKPLLLAGIALAALVPILAVADVGPPVHMQITEREPGLYAVQWRVPKALPPRAVPSPEFPETCTSVSDREVEDQGGAWLFTRQWHCETSLAGQVVGMRYPFPDLALTTVVRVDLLSGDRFAHVLSPGEGPWRLPEGTAAPDLVLGARRALVAGLSHVLGSWIHLAFLLVLGLLGGYGGPIRLVSSFTLGQVAGALGAGLTTGIGSVPAELGFAVAVALIAREALRPAEERRRLAGLAAAAGLVHGLGITAILAGGLGDESGSLAAQLLAILGMDATHLVGAVGVAALWTFLARRPAGARAQRPVAYTAGAAGVALAIGLALSGGVADPGTVAPSLQVGDGSAASPTAGVEGSRRLAPTAPDAPIQSYLSVEPFEVRHEAMLRLVGLAQELGLDAESTLEVASQSAVAERLTELVLGSAKVQVDGEYPEALIRRVDFMTVDPTGALPRPNPVPEPVAEAVVGVVVAYPIPGMPDDVSLDWDPFPTVTDIIPATVIDPESVASRTLSAGEPSLIWENALTEDPIPTVDAVEVEPISVPVPLLSLPLLALAVILLIAGVRGRRRTVSIAASRVVVALAFLVGPLVQTAVALPGSAGRTPSERQARRILAGLLPNIYRALEFKDEATIYDRLAVSVTGATLTDVYLEQRRALEMEERGGAQARVEAVEVLEASEIESRDTGFEVRSTWTVGGMVTHFGHRHFRQNRYDARIGIVPDAGDWKISSISVLEQERVR
ncbi:MAG: HupE/UreJ family protein [Gemmatimonadota bacterium]|nr:MAG: HupE/UreJ family protein [Gemmatimonadota bacterium]